MNTQPMSRTVNPAHYLVAVLLPFAALIASPVRAQFVMTPQEIDVNRDGGDISGEPAASARECSVRCGATSRCAAMTFVQHPDSAGGVCWLKKVVPAPTEVKGMISAVKVMGPLEASTNRQGHDLSDDPASNAIECSNRCAKTAGCKAMTFVQGATPNSGVCWLKSSAPARTGVAGMTSAVKRTP